MNPTNSLLSKSKKDLAAQHARVIEALMVLWGVKHPMEDWQDPIQALERLTNEANGSYYDYEKNV